MRISFSIVTYLLLTAGTFAQVPPGMKNPEENGYTLAPEQRAVRLEARQLFPSHTMTGEKQTLLLDLGDSTLTGRVFFGQAFFDAADANYLQTRFRERADIRNGKAVLNLEAFLRKRSITNANGWTSDGILGYRLDLLQTAEGKTSPLGIYDSQVFFRILSNGIRPIISLIEGPIVSLVQSDHPEWIVLSFETDRSGTGFVEVDGVGSFVGTPDVRRHEIRVSGLTPSHEYRYRAGAIDGPDTAKTPWFAFRSAPKKGATEVAFAYAGDARASYGGGEYEYLGVNRMILNQILSNAARQRTDFFLFGGDLISGFNNSVRDHRMQLRGFKQSAAPFLLRTPMYTAMGNHETLAHFFVDSAGRRVGFDRWPYATESAEAVFADEFVQPTHGPVAQPGLPSYDESAFAFHYGAVKVIIFNNNYWYAHTARAKNFGGCPEGYILPEQLEWIEQELRSGEMDATVRYIVLLAQEPVFPAGGHSGDAMWYSGNNNIRAYKRNESGEVVPFADGIVDVRNKLWTMISNSKKVALVLGSDEHNYQRMLIDATTPVGVLSDDSNKDGILNDGRLSPNPDFRYPTWFIISGGAGAPYYTREDAPWSPAAVKSFSPRHHHVLVRATEAGIGLEVYSNNGELLDEVKDLMKVRRKE